MPQQPRLVAAVGGFSHPRNPVQYDARPVVVVVHRRRDDGGAEPSKTDEFLIERSDFRIRLADSGGRRNRVGLLVKRMYSSRGYAWEPHHSRWHDPNRMTLEASSGEKTFATLTIGLDSDAGLLADTLYRHEIDTYRARGCRVVEVCQLAVDPEHGSKELLGSLFHLLYIYATFKAQATDAFIEVNPRHVGFHARMLGFEPVGERRICPRVGAPAVLMHLDLSYMAAQIALHGGHRQSGHRTLYSFFFSEAEEVGVRKRFLRVLSNDRIMPARPPVATATAVAVA